MSTKLYTLIKEVTNRYGNPAFLCKSLFGDDMVLTADYYHQLVQLGKIEFKTKSFKSKLIDAF